MASCQGFQLVVLPLLNPQYLLASIVAEDAEASVLDASDVH